VAITVLAFAVAAWLEASVSLTLNVLDERPTAELGYVLIALAVTGVVGVAGVATMFVVARRSRASAHA